MDDYINLEQQDFSHFGKDSRISGIFKLAGPTMISAHLEGELIMEDNSDICIERDGHFNGKIKCSNIKIFGTFEGGLISTGKVEIFPSACITGEIKAFNLVVYPGAKLNIEGHAET